MKYLRLAYASLLVAALLVAMGCASNTQHSSTGEYIDDTVITTKVKTAIFGDPTLSSAEINVETYKGVVQLSGFVSSQADIDRAVDLTRRVSGVVSVENDMQLK